MELGWAAKELRIWMIKALASGVTEGETRSGSNNS